MDNKYFHSVILEDERCIGCTRCLKVCPTEAIRLREGKARIIGERCIDCGECIRICPNHAKSAITDSLEMLKKFKYKIAVPSMVLFGQFADNVSINEILTAIKSLGFDDVYEPSLGAEVIRNVIAHRMLKDPTVQKPLINSSCPAILRLIQIRFPDLLSHVVDIETHIEITARTAKLEAAKKTGLDVKDIGIFFITPCTARVTSIRNPLGIKESYVDAAVSMRVIYGEIVRNLGKQPVEKLSRSTREGLLFPISGGQASALGIRNYISVDGIDEVIKVLDEIEMGKLKGLEFFEGMACIGGCAGGPLTIENSFIARNKIREFADKLPPAKYTEEEKAEFVKLYNDLFIRFTEEIEPMAILRLDTDIAKSMKKMEMIKEMLKYLPGLDCGVCGAPTCRAFAEDIVRGEGQKSICIVKTMENFKAKMQIIEKDI